MVLRMRVWMYRIKDAYISGKGHSHTLVLERKAHSWSVCLLPDTCSKSGCHNWTWNRCSITLLISLSLSLIFCKIGRILLMRWLLRVAMNTMFTSWSQNVFDVGTIIIFQLVSEGTCVRNLPVLSWDQGCEMSIRTVCRFTSNSCVRTVLLCNCGHRPDGRWMGQQEHFCSWFEYTLFWWGWSGGRDSMMA